MNSVKTKIDLDEFRSGTTNIILIQTPSLFVGDKQEALLGVVLITSFY
jgi:hypothetical protein